MIYKTSPEHWSEMISELPEEMDELSFLQMVKTKIKKQKELDTVPFKQEH
jgi:hypothetical protein